MTLDEAAQKVMDTLNAVQDAGFRVSCHWSETLFVSAPDETAISLTNGENLLGQEDTPWTVEGRWPR